MHPMMRQLSAQVAYALTCLKTQIAMRPAGTMPMSGAAASTPSIVYDSVSSCCMEFIMLARMPASKPRHVVVKRRK